MVAEVAASLCGRWRAARRSASREKPTAQKAKVASVTPNLEAGVAQKCPRVLATGIRGSWWRGLFFASIVLKTASTRSPTSAPYTTHHRARARHVNQHDARRDHRRTLTATRLFLVCPRHPHLPLRHVLRPQPRSNVAMAEDLNIIANSSKARKADQRCQTHPAAAKAWQFIAVHVAYWQHRRQRDARGRH